MKKIARMRRHPVKAPPLHPVKITHIEIQHGGAAAKPAPKPAADAK